MPNWRIASSSANQIVADANVFATRTVDYAKAGFPLTTAQMQLAIMPEEHVRAMRVLVGSGIDLPHSDRIEVQIKCEDLPGLQRGIALKLLLPEKVFEKKASYWEENKWDSRHHTQLDLSVIDDAEREALRVWCTHVIRALRLKKMAVATVKSVLQYAPTAYHLEVAWPGIRAFIKDAYIRDRLRREPKYSGHYAPHPHINTPEFKKRIQATETILTQGHILDPYKHPEGTINVLDVQWERLEKDPQFT